MDLGLTGKVAMVAAASQGLGRAIAEAFAREGCKVSICSRNETAIQATAVALRRETRAEVIAVRADVTHPQDIQNWVQKTVETFGTIHILVTNAGGPVPGNFDDLSEEDWYHTVDLTLMSVVRMIKAVLPYMRQQKWGRIINLTSTSTKQPILGLLLSNSLRSAVVGLTKTLSFELAREGILVNNVAPGRFDTERVRQLDQDRAIREGKTFEEIRKESEQGIPLGRLGKPEEFANAVVFLASEKASYITGVTLQVDGGLTRCVY